MARETTYGAAIPENIRADQAGLTRRTLTRGMAVGALVVTINGLDIVMTPREARAANAPLKTLTPVEAAALEAVAETILPGAKAAGIVPFVDHHLSVPPGECLLAVRLTDGLSAPYAPVYQKALAAIDQAAQKASGVAFAALPPDKQVAFVTAMATGQPQAWVGPPAGGVYRLLRGDALDVVYAVPEGYTTVGVPYMPHVFPEPKW